MFFPSLEVGFPDKIKAYKIYMTCQDDQVSKWLGLQAPNVGGPDSIPGWRTGRKVMTNIDSILKSRDITLPTKVNLVKAMGFPVVMYGYESWTIKKAERRRIDAFELWCWRRLLRVPWTRKEIQPVHPNGDQSWVFIGRTDVEAETPILWPPDAKSWLIWKDPDAGKDWGQEEMGMTEDELVGWHHRLYGHWVYPEFG